MAQQFKIVNVHPEDAEAIQMWSIAERKPIYQVVRDAMSLYYHAHLPLIEQSKAGE